MMFVVWYRWIHEPSGERSDLFKVVMPTKIKLDLRTNPFQKGGSDGGPFGRSCGNKRRS